MFYWTLLHDLWVNAKIKGKNAIFLTGIDGMNICAHIKLDIMLMFYERGS